MLRRIVDVGRDFENDGADRKRECDQRGEPRDCDPRARRVPASEERRGHRERHPAERPPDRYRSRPLPEEDCVAPRRIERRRAAGRRYRQIEPREPGDREPPADGYDGREGDGDRCERTHEVEPANPPIEP